MTAALASLGVHLLVILGLLIMTGTIAPDQVPQAIGRTFLFAFTAFFLIYVLKLLLLLLVCILHTVLSLLAAPLVLVIVIALLAVTGFIIRGRKKRSSREHHQGDHRE